MIGLLCFVLAVLASPFKSKLRLEAENAVLRHQLIVLRRRLHGRVRLANHDRWLKLRVTSSAIGIGSMAASSHADCAPWASGTSRICARFCNRTRAITMTSGRTGH